jgi:transcriptional regulator with XRE-family HTH domain
MSKKEAWAKKYQQIAKTYPNINVNSLTGKMVDEDMFIKIIGDVLKSERTVSTPGKRPGLSRADGLERLNKILERDFSDQKFPSAFRNLTAGKSVRAIQSKTGLSKSHVQRLLAEIDHPSVETLEKASAAFNKHPSYFLEYRIFKIMEYVNSFLMDNPETATTWYKKIWG